MTRKIFINAFLLGASVLLLCAMIFFGLQYTQTIEETYDALKGEAAYAACGLEQGGEDYLKNLDKINRVTWIAADGSVLFDSEFSDLTTNQGDYPEVKNALETGEGQGIRTSESGGNDTMYYAFLCEDGTILRLSRPLAAVRHALVAVSPVLWVFVLVLIVSGVIAFRVAKQILRPINEMDVDEPDLTSTYPELEPLVGRLQEQKLTIEDQMTQLRRREKELTVLTDNMAEGFLMVDRNGILLSANRTSKKLTGELKIGDELHFQSEEAEHLLQEVLMGNRTELLLQKGSRTWRLIANPVLSHGKVSGAVVLMLDVTEREQRERLRKEFSANVSHELKTPLTSISGFAELISEGLCGEDKIKEFSGDIYRESQRLIALVEDIIKLSKLDEEGTLPEFEETDLYETAEKTKEVLSAPARERNIELLLAGSRAVIPGVKQLLFEMVYNLCDNAIKYNKDGGQVTIEVAELEKEIRLSVEDTGIGIPYAEQDRVFERFYRVDKSHSKEIGGTGLGLSIVKHGAQLHGARVEMESEPGTGTKITLVFHKRG